jgi:hypothetical protein
MARKACSLFLFCALIAGTAARLLGQTGATGAVLGTVTDKTGAVVPNAAIEVTNVDTGVVHKAVTTGAGDYFVPYLNPGRYSVTAEAPGFAKSVSEAFTLSVGQEARVNTALTPGQVTETITVASTQVALDTDNEALTNYMSGTQVADLPLNGRNFMQLLLVGAGAVTVGGEQGTMLQGVGNAVSINGGRPEGNNYTLDGLVNTDQALVTPAVILSQDAIKEFKVESGTYSAQYGFSASQINLISQNGTNQLHGSLWEFNRNDAFDAKPFPTASDYSAAVPTVNPELRQNQFGYVLSGPVVFPKLYNGKNHTFFMANYEGWRIINGARVEDSVPNPPTLTGNFSAETYQTQPSLGLPGGPLPAYGTPDCVKLLSVGQNCMPVNPLTGHAYPNNVIPTSAITSRLAQVAIQYGYFATPTVPNAAEGLPNFIENIGLPLSTNQQTYRLDESLGKYGLLFGRGTYSTYQNSADNTASLVYGIETQYEKQENWEISHTINLGQANVNNFRFGYLNSQAPQGAPPPPAAAVSQLGETGVFTHFIALQQTWPDIGLSQYSGFGGPINAYTGSVMPAWEYADDFTSIHGRHTFTMGFDRRTWQLIRNLDDDFYGDWSYTAQNVQTNNINCPNATALCGTGNAIGDMLTGYYAGVGGFVPGPLSPTNQAGNPQDHVFGYFAPYFQDDFKVNQRLVVNMGLRWDYRAAAYEAHNHFFWLDTTNTQGGLCYADPQLTTDGVAPGVGYNGGPILRYCGRIPRPAPWYPFAPRVGFAYSLPDNKTVIRAGFGLFYDSFEGREIDDSADIYPYSIRNSLTPTQNPLITKIGNNLFPAFNKLTSFPVSTLSFIAVIESEDPLDPYVQSRTLSIQREIARNTTIEINYIGTKGTHLLDRQNIAQPYSIPASSLAFCQQIPTPTVAPCPTSTRLPYPNFTGFYIDSKFAGYSNYNAMNVQFERRQGNTALTAIYTWAKSMDDKSAAAGVGATGSGYQGFMNNHDPNLDYGPSDFEVNNRFVASYVYQLPVGRGQRFMGDMNQAENAVLGGWQLSGITTFQTGFPYSIQGTDVSGLDDTQFQRGNYVPGCNIHGNLTQKFQRINMACFTQPAAGTYGNTGRNFLRQPGINDWDMGIAKYFPITERAQFQFHVDMFNAFNRTQYNLNVGGLATGGSGGGSSIDNGIGDPLQGLITSSSPGRIIQLSGKITF